MQSQSYAERGSKTITLQTVSPVLCTYTHLSYSTLSYPPCESKVI